jgi:DeoR/GlpR family transcriptional regulator of sugar metabolism
MLRVARQAKILQFINERGFVENEELARLLNVTQTTIKSTLRAKSDKTRSWWLIRHGFSGGWGRAIL